MSSELNCIGCGKPGCDGKAECEYYESTHKSAMPPNMTKIIESEVKTAANAIWLGMAKSSPYRMDEAAEVIRESLHRTLQAAVIELLPEEKEVDAAGIVGEPDGWTSAINFHYNSGFNAAIADIKRRAEG